MSLISNNDLLQVAVESAIAASHIIMEALDTPRVASLKGKTDLVTETDHESENIIKSIIKSFFPEHSFLACLLYTSPSPRDGLLSRMPSSA